jgi:hypothetical protein
VTEPALPGAGGVERCGDGFEVGDELVELARLAYAAAARSSVSDSIRSLVSRPVSLSQPEASMRPRARIPSTTAASRAGGRWWTRPKRAAGMPSESAWSTCASVPRMPSVTRAAL